MLIVNEIVRMMILNVWNRRVQVLFLLCLLVCGGVFSCTEKANATVPVAENNERPKEYDLYLLIGQSNEAIRRTKAAQEYGTLKAVLWHQGESGRE